MSAALAEARRILTEIEELRASNRRLAEVGRLSLVALRRIEALLSHDLSRMQAVRALVQGALADVQRLAPEALT